VIEKIPDPENKCQLGPERIKKEALLKERCFNYAIIKWG
jgi:hypothetical protein